jgi:5-methylcytosine-specific restriction endonuclease McrBC regulatory subunit McrC
MNIRGTIDITRHIKENTPFLGKVAYTTREFTQDNYLIQLVRHTIEHIRSSSLGGKTLLRLNEETRQNVRTVELVTPSYNLGDRKKVVNSNKKSIVRHAFYTEYKALQHLCLMILSHRKHSFGTGSKHTKGILFDVAWLWEAYLFTLLKDFEFRHPSNRDQKKTDWLNLYDDSVNDRRLVCPDYYRESKSKNIVADAKYKPLNKKRRNKLETADIKQMVVYSYILEAKGAWIIHPGSYEDGVENVTDFHLIGPLRGYGAIVNRISLRIPKYESKDNKKFKDFEREMKAEEDIFKTKIDTFLKNM